ncbi:MAG: hypothetical protein KBS57_00900 [Alistipes sp.]|nr:hypothetical protein [Candidatus Minthomonas equi]
MTRKRFITIVLILVFLQIVLNLSLSISTYLMLAPLCFVIQGLERGASSVKCMIVAFALGLVVDIFSSGIPGLWSAALVAASVPRLIIVKRRFWKNDTAYYDMPSPVDMGQGAFFLCSFAVSLVFFISYALLEKMAVALTWNDIVRVVLSIIVNTVCVYLIAISVQDNKRR